MIAFEQTSMQRHLAMPADDLRRVSAPARAETCRLLQRGGLRCLFRRRLLLRPPLPLRSGDLRTSGLTEGLAFALGGIGADARTRRREAYAAAATCSRKSPYCGVPRPGRCRPAVQEDR